MKTRKKKATPAKKAPLVKKQTKFIHRSAGGGTLNLVGSYRDGPCPSGQGVCRCYYDPATGNYDKDCTQIG
jgi:hypothetical protein